MSLCLDRCMRLRQGLTELAASRRLIGRCGRSWLRRRIGRCRLARRSVGRLRLRCGPGSLNGA